MRRRLPQQPDQRGEGEHEEGRDEISSLKMRACTMKSGVIAVAAADAKDGRSGSTSRARLKVANTRTPPAKAPSTRASLAKDGRSGGCTTSATACAKSIMKRG